MRKEMYVIGGIFVIFVICGVIGLIHGLTQPPLSEDNQAVLDELAEVHNNFYLACTCEYYGTDLEDLPTSAESLTQRDQLRDRLQFTDVEYEEFVQRADSTREQLVLASWHCPDKPPAFTKADGSLDYEYFAR